MNVELNWRTKTKWEHNTQQGHWIRFLWVIFFLKYVIFQTYLEQTKTKF